MNRMNLLLGSMGLMTVVYALGGGSRAAADRPGDSKDRQDPKEQKDPKDPVGKPEAIPMTCLDSQCEMSCCNSGHSCAGFCDASGHCRCFTGTCDPSICQF